MNKTKKKKKTFLTTLKAYCWEEGKYFDFGGPTIKAKSQKKAEKYCRENYPYLKVLGVREPVQIIIDDPNLN